MLYSDSNCILLLNQVIILYEHDDKLPPKTAEKIKTNVTLCFSPIQALMAAKAGASYISPFVGRLDDISHRGMELVEQILSIYENYGYETEVIVASIRNPIHVLDAALMGADISTVPYKVMEQAREEVVAADLLIIIGSSLTVYPAAALPSLAVQTGKRLLIVNREFTPMDTYANIVIRGMAGVIMPKIFSTLKEII